MRRALLIVGKAPVAGHAKTRLVPPLSFEAAAVLYRGFLLDTLALADALGWECVSLVHPAGEGAALRTLAPAGVRLCEQRGLGLGDALPDAFGRHLEAGYERVVLIGSDSPTLPLALVEQACAALDEHDLSLGPTRDGGYYLLGLRAPQPGVFANIAWSTPRVCRQTRARARQLRLRVRTLAPWYDVDEPDDLGHLQRDLRRLPPGCAMHTRATLDQLAGTSTLGVQPERVAYSVASRLPTSPP